MVAFDNSVHGGLRVFGGQTPPQFFVIECTHIVQLPMQVQNIGRPGTLVQIVYILRDDTHIEVLFQVYQPAVAGIWFGGKQFLAAFVVELVYQCRIAGKAIGTGHVHHGIISHRPPASRKVAMPLSALIPAPVDTTNFFI